MSRTRTTTELEPPACGGAPAAGTTAPGTASTVRLAATGVGLIAVCYGLARFAYGLFVPTFRAEFGLDATTVGALASGSYAGYCVAVVAATVATGRWGARRVAVLAGASAAAGTALIAAAPGTVVLACGVVLAGSSTGLASPPLAQAVARAVPLARQPRVQTVVNAGTGLGVLASGPVALVAGEHWRGAWAAFAVVALAVTVVAWRTVPAGVGGVAGDASTPGRDGEPRTVPPGSARLLVAAGLMGFGSAAVWTFGQDLVASASGGVVATVMWIALGAAGLLGAFAGDLTARIGLARSWTGAMVVLGGVTAALALVPDVPALAIAAAAVFGAVYIALSGLLLLWGTRVDSRRPVRGVGAAFLLIAVGQALGAPLLGVLADAVTTPGAFLAAVAVIALGALVRPGPRVGG